MSHPGRAVLQIGSDAAAARWRRATLSTTGWSVMTCRGPGADLCPVEHGRPCPLVREADVVIVDLALETHTNLENGISPGELLAYYLGEDKPVIALTRSPHGIRPFVDERVKVLDQPPSADALGRAIAEAIPPFQSPQVLPQKIAP